jgi:hypothetical protein
MRLLRLFRPPDTFPREAYCRPCEPGGSGRCLREKWNGDLCQCPCQVTKTIVNGDLRTWHQTMHAVG